jgi:hypothetical protein
MSETTGTNRELSFTVSSDGFVNWLNDYGDLHVPIFYDHKLGWEVRPACGDDVTYGISHQFNLREEVFFEVHQHRMVASFFVLDVTARLCRIKEVSGEQLPPSVEGAAYFDALMAALRDDGWIEG